MGKKKIIKTELVAPDGSSGVVWHNLATTDEVFARAKTNINGLDDAERAARFLTYGANKLTEADKAGFFKKLWNQVNNSLIWILIVSAIIAAGLRDWPDFGLIIAVIVINIGIGLVQEGKAEKSAEAIKKMLSPIAVVVKEGKRVTVNSNDVVPGDVIFLQSGDKIPADVRFVTATNLQVQEAILTGESVPVAKNTDANAVDAPLGDRHCMGFSGTMVVYGQGLGIAVATGDNAELGKINALVSSVEGGSTPLLDQLEVFGMWVAILTVIVAIGTFLIAWQARGFDASGGFSLGVGVAVAIIPEGLPSVVTITLALGVQHMAKNKAIIRQLPAVETLGAVGVICSDKTGTLTKNEMTATAIHTREGAYAVSGGGYAPYGEITCNGAALSESDKVKIRNMAFAGILCNDSGIEGKTSDGVVINTSNGAALPPTADNAEWKISGDPTEAALLTLGMKTGTTDIEGAHKKYPRISVIPFESDYKFHATMHDIDQPDGSVKRTVFVKGAWDKLIERSATQAINNDTTKSEPCNHAMWLEAASSYAKKGLRVLAFAQFYVASDATTMTVDDVLKGSPRLQLNCLIAIVDPPREECKAAVHVCHEAGIIVKMITGDHPDTAAYIGGQLGITSEEVLTGQRIEEMTDDELYLHVEKCNIYARASPEHKLRIVKQLQKRGHICAMTGDGVNDAPALKQANVGTAMGITGTEVAKEAAKMILADDNFTTIVTAVREGRGVYDNLRKILFFSLPTNMAQGFCIVAAVVIGLDNPLSPIQVLYVNLVTSVTLGIVIALEPPEPDVMTRPPRRNGKPLMGKYVTWRAFFVTLMFVVAMLGNMEWERVRNPDVYVDGVKVASCGKINSEQCKEARGIAMTTLVIAQCFYGISCRYIKKSTFSLKSWIANKWMFLSIIVNAGLQCFLLYTPGVNDIWEMSGISANAWGRVILFSVVIYFIVELEKVVGPKYLSPIFVPIAKAIGRAIPSCKCKRKEKTAVPEKAPEEIEKVHSARLELSRSLRSSRTILKDDLGAPATDIPASTTGNATPADVAVTVGDNKQ